MVANCHKEGGARQEPSKNRRDTWGIGDGESIWLKSSDTPKMCTEIRFIETSKLTHKKA